MAKRHVIKRNGFTFSGAEDDEFICITSPKVDIKLVKRHLAYAKSIGCVIDRKANNGVGAIETENDEQLAKLIRWWKANVG